MNDILLLKLGEIVLKGLNRKGFEQKLMGNIRRRLVPIGKFKVTCMQSTVYVEALEDGADMDAAFEAVQKIFGVVKISRAAAWCPSENSRSPACSPPSTWRLWRRTPI